MSHGGRNAASLAGQFFGKLHVASQALSSGGRARWHCLCGCGNKLIVSTTDLRNGHTTSCGCSRGRHKMHLSPEYQAWKNLIQRCGNPKNRSYKNYGGRGITVCTRWLSFDNFFADMGHRPSLDHSVDRKDSDGNYEPDNCRWATEAEQRRNKRNNVWVRLPTGEVMVAADAAKVLGWKPGSTNDFLAQGRDGVIVLPTLPADVRATLGDRP